MKRTIIPAIPVLLAFAAGRLAAETLPEMNLGGYQGISVSAAPTSYNAGYTMYAALLGRHQYAGYNRKFSAALHAHTWMFAQDSTANVYTDIEGGAGAGGGYGNPWNHNGFGMGVVGPAFAGVANGPTGGWGDGGAYAVAQISPRLLYPPAADMFRGGSCGEFVGHGYYALPLMPGKATTDGVNVPTGDRWWTLFFNTRNFTGPVAAVVPYFFAKFSKTKPELAGQLLDSRWAQPNGQFSSESHTVPGRQYDGPEGSFVRVQPMFTVLNDGANGTISMNSPTVYDQTALWNAAKEWFTNNGPAPVGPFNAKGAFSKNVSGGNVGWAVWGSPLSPDKSMPMAWKDVLTSYAADTKTWGYKWGINQVVLTQFANGKPAAKMPEYYQLLDNVWTPVSRGDLPPSVAAKLAQDNLVSSPSVPRAGTWTRPNDSSWTTPGPVAGPFQTRIDNGMVLTYSWYRFKDQPALLNAGLTEAERDQIQAVAEKIHRAWPNGGSYIPAPTRGTLADVDPALLVTPPAGMEVGYVPIATKQEWGGLVTYTWKQAASGSLSVAARWDSGSAPADGGHSYYKLDFNPSGSYTVVNDRSAGYGYGGFAVNQLNFAGAVTLSGKPVTLTADYESLPQINQNSSSTVEISAPLNMDVTTILGGTGNGTVNITSDIFGPWQGLTVKGSGTWRLSGNNRYDGVTSVEAGTLSCSQPTSLGSGELKISTGAVVNLNFSGTRTIAGLTLGGTIMRPGVYGSSSSPAANKDSRFSGNGTVTVLAQATGPKGAGRISRDVWTGVTGTAVSAIPVGTAPNTSDTLTSFEGPSNWADNYGTRIHGYLTAPDTGSFTFWIASDESSELWISTDDQPANKVKIAAVTSPTGAREWNKFSSQKSSAINLIGGRQYYIEALHKEGSGNDHVAVGWSKPGESTSAPTEVIPGVHLTPYVPRGTGSISREAWTNVPGSPVSSIPVGTAPTISDTLKSFEAPRNWEDEYGTRIRGYITAPYTGGYIFWIATDDAGELWLSSDDRPVNKGKIAQTTQYTSAREWNKFPSQKSAVINLVAGSRYYVEVLHKEGVGDDHVAVGWSKPGESTSTPSEVIPGSQLSPYSARATITTQPVSRTVMVGATATFTVVATGDPEPTYQWRRDGTNIAGATNASYTTPATVIGDNGALFSVVVSDAVGSVTSTNATLTVSNAPIAPTITQQPANITVMAGASATFTVVATGLPAPTYQWRKGGTNITGATSASYTTPATAIGDHGAIFSVVVTNSAGSVTSSNATLTVSAGGDPIVGPSDGDGGGNGRCGLGAAQAMLLLLMLTLMLKMARRI